MSVQNPRLPIHDPQLLPSARLTPREREVIDLLIGKCLAMKEVASALGITPSTMGQHMGHIYGKTRTHSQLDLARWCHRNGLVNWLAEPPTSPL